MARKKQVQEVGLTREAEIDELASDFRRAQCDDRELFDPVRFVELELPKIVPGFEFLPVGPEYLGNAETVRARADFKNGKVLYVAEEVYYKAQEGDAQERFTLAHEAGHVVLHNRTGLTFARNVMGTNEYVQEQRVRARKTYEIEANLFAGAVLLPVTALDPTLMTGELARTYGVSQLAAEKGVQQAKRYKIYLDLLGQGYRPNGRNF